MTTERKTLRFLEEITYDDRLNGMEKWLLFLLPRQPKDVDGSIRVSARRLALLLRCHDKTAAKHLRNLARAEYISIEQDATNSSGGFKIFFKKAALAASIVFLLGNAPALHSQNYYEGKEGSHKLSGSSPFIICKAKDNEKARHRTPKSDET